MSTGSAFRLQVNLSHLMLVFTSLDNGGRVSRLDSSVCCALVDEANGFREQRETISQNASLHLDAAGLGRSIRPFDEQRFFSCLDLTTSAMMSKIPHPD